jgi:hypothetical protein
MTRRRRRRLSVLPRSRSRRQARFSSDLSGVVKVQAWTAATSSASLV